MQLKCDDKVIDLTTPVVMGILNVTPDSFSDGGRFCSQEQAVTHALQMVEDGAAIIDVGGESTRPGAAPVSVSEELDRVIPVIEMLAKEIQQPISIDTFKPEVMQAAVDAGASLINDVNALRAPDAVRVAQLCNVPICLMHMQGEPRNMQDNPSYTDVVAEVKYFLQERIDACIAAGIPKQHIIVDPGIGFGKLQEHNLTLLRELHALTALDAPVLVGVSRKSFIGHVLQRKVNERLAGSLTLALLAAKRGAMILRVHDVAHTVDALKMLEAVQDVEASY